ncbi:MAG: TolC family protein, partial [Myxococcota bacterium]
MMIWRRSIGLLLVASLRTSSARAQEQRTPTLEMTYEHALARAREQAPAVAAATARAKEADSRVDVASVWRFNPQLFGAAGPRFQSDGTTIQAFVTAQQWFEAGGQRGDRIRAAQAEATAERARAQDARRLILLEVSIAFASTLYWTKRIELARASTRIAEDIFRIAERRHDIGDIGGLEHAVAALAVTRARSRVDRTRASRARAAGKLKALLGITTEHDIACRGDLHALRPN